MSEEEFKQERLYGKRRDPLGNTINDKP